MRTHLTGKIGFVAFALTQNVRIWSVQCLDWTTGKASVCSFGSNQNL